MNPENYSTLQTLTTLALPVLTITSIVFVMFVANQSDLLSFTNFRLGENSYYSDGVFENNENDEVGQAVDSDDQRNKKSLINSLGESPTDNNGNSNSRHGSCDDELIVSKVYTEYDHWIWPVNMSMTSQYEYEYWITLIIIEPLKLR